MYREKWFQVGIATIMIFLIILLGTQVRFIFTPLVIIVKTLFPPIILAGVLYYLLRPLVNLLSRKIHRTLAIIIVFIGIAGVITGAVFLIGPELQKQFRNLVDNMPAIINNIQKWVMSLTEKEWFAQFQDSDYFSVEKYLSKFEENAQHRPARTAASRPPRPPRASARTPDGQKRAAAFSCPSRAPRASGRDLRRRAAGRRRRTASPPPRGARTSARTRRE